MNVVRPFKATPGVTEAQTREELGSFRSPSTAATIWQRTMPKGIEDWLAQIDADLLPRGRVIVQASDAAQVIAQLCDISRLPKDLGRAWLEKDIAELFEAFADLMEAQFLRLRLDVITNNACRKFHVDTITGRLVCTYRGTGTQYGISDGHRNPDAVSTTATGSAILMRGKLWPAYPDSGLVHRSPPIEGTGEIRLVLVLDPVEAQEAGRDVYLTH